MAVEVTTRKFGPGLMQPRRTRQAIVARLGRYSMIAAPVLVQGATTVDVPAMAMLRKGP